MSEPKNSDSTKFPTTLLEAVKYFSDPDRALDFMISIRWPDGQIACPRCNSGHHSFLKTRRIWKCLECKKQFSAKLGTIFEDSPLGFDKWFPTFWMIVNAKNGVSSCEIARSIGVTQKSAWHMLHRIRLALQEGSFMKMDGQVEADETFIGGKARNMHKGKRKVRGTGGIGKTAVMGLLERGDKEETISRVKLKVVKTTKRKELQKIIRDNVEVGSEVMTDALRSYIGLEDQYIHQVIDHAEKYVEGHVHTNGMENFWSLLKRTIKGTYVSVEPFHLFRYLDEQAFRFNERKGKDQDRFLKGLEGIRGRLLRYSNLTGKTVFAEI